MACRNSGKGDDPPDSWEILAFDRWLSKQLQALYGPIASEPVSDGLIALIDRDAGSKARIL